MILTASYIMLFLFGVLIGNFITTVFYRLPRNIMICGFDPKSTRPPFCSNCGHVLCFYEYLPILSWVSTLGKCNYCHIPITKLYIALELIGGLLAVILYHLIGHKFEYFFIYFCFSILVILNIFIHLKHNIVPITITLTIVVLGMIYRTLNDQEIFLWVTNLSIASILSLWIIRDNLNGQNFSNHSKSPTYSENNLRFDTSNSELLKVYLKQQTLHLILPASLWCSSYSILIFAVSIVFWYLISIRLLRKLYFCGQLLRRCGAQILTYIKYAPVLRSVIFLHLPRSSEFPKKSIIENRLFYPACLLNLFLISLWHQL